MIVIIFIENDGFCIARKSALFELDCSIILVDAEKNYVAVLMSIL